MLETTVTLPNTQYKIQIESHLLSQLGAILSQFYAHKKVALVADETVFKLYGRKVEQDLLSHQIDFQTILIKPGEKSKNIKNAEFLWDVFNEMNLSKSDLVLSFGGGVTGDLAGFAASTFLRGISIIHIPTTLLSQVDSSVGGKCGINLKAGKNLVGSFHQPDRVLIDPTLLDTLPPQIFADGMSEVIKYGAIASISLFETLEHHTPKTIGEVLEAVILECCQIKQKFVEEDQFDQGQRMLLNFGHTIGHSIEKVFKYTTYSHGHAVGIGMLGITEQSEALGLTEINTTKRLLEVLKTYGITYTFPLDKRQEILEAIGHDKKIRNQKINLALLKTLGESYLHPIDIENLSNFLPQ